MILSAPVVFWCGKEVFWRALKLARSMESSMDTLVAVGTGTAFAVSVASTLGISEALVYNGHPVSYLLLQLT
jgi:cation transport ATPase